MRPEMTHNEKRFLRRELISDYLGIGFTLRLIKLSVRMAEFTIYGQGMTYN
jgi:hypothetical protein